MGGQCFFRSPCCIGNEYLAKAGEKKKTECKPYYACIAESSRRHWERKGDIINRFLRSTSLSLPVFRPFVAAAKTSNIGWPLSHSGFSLSRRSYHLDHPVKSAYALRYGPKVVCVCGRVVCYSRTWARTNQCN